MQKSLVNEWMYYECMYFLIYAIFNTIFHSLLHQAYSNFKFLSERESDWCDFGQVSLPYPDSCVQEIRLDGLVLTQQGLWTFSLGRVSWVWPATPLNSLRNRIRWKIAGDHKYLEGAVGNKEFTDISSLPLKFDRGWRSGQNWKELQRK